MIKSKIGFYNSIPFDLFNFKTVLNYFRLYPLTLLENCIEKQNPFVNTLVLYMLFSAFLESVKHVQSDENLHC